MNKKSDLLWSALQEKSRAAESNMDPLDRKRTGSFYTNLSLTDAMMRELVSKIASGIKPIESYRFLEPCVGVGNFVFSYLKEINKLNLDRASAIKLINNIYVADINKDALNTYKTSLREVVYSFWKIELDDVYFEKHIGVGLLVDVTASDLKYISIKDVFGEEIVEPGFDIVATNPPYKNLKAERTHYANKEEYDRDKEKYLSLSKTVKNKFRYSVDGGLNLYKLFVEEIIDNFAAKDAYVSLLIPASILSDKTCSKLRTHILQDMNLISAKVIGEGSGFVEAQQALSALLIHKGEKTSFVNVTKDYCKAPGETADIHIEDILNQNTGNAIFAITDDEYKILKKLRRFPTVKELDFIVNLRGELDLTADKQYITSVDTGFKLLRGRNVGYYCLSESNESEFVEADFVEKTKKSAYVKTPRIICQQIANMHKERRVTFAPTPKNCVLGNSCNFISVNENEFGVDIYAILGLFNTKIINWLFKLTSSNNHVNNYEIGCFPVPVSSHYLKEISTSVRNYLQTDDDDLVEKIEILARKAYRLDDENEDSENNIFSMYLTDVSRLAAGLTLKDAASIIKGETPVLSFAEGLGKFETNVVKGITDKYQKIYNGYILNHTTFKLSALDLEMIKSVPPGGSWKNIPQSTVNKSQRLKRITQTGGRTTLYGRLDYEKPSYTITTYFNRPGNGTYVHPVRERVLSVREAARFQAFKDDYYFFGNQTQLLKQVGNAVPPLLAYQIAKMIKEKTGCIKSIDLFCGAGGMTAGFKAAGIKSLLSNDIEESACVTLKINNPEIPVLCGDITHEDTKRVIEAAAKAGDADIICGGPPCQGFSTAGFRSENDPRNRLFRDFADVVKRVNPKVIVFENVEGLLSYKKGQTYREVHALFAELGYRTEGRTLVTSDYAIPQKRKRVIIICTRNDLDITPSELFPAPISSNEDEQVTARETIFDLEEIKCSEKAKYNSTYESDILGFFKGKLSYSEYLLGRSKRNVISARNGDCHVDADGQIILEPV